jgi:hypothetical protein
MGEDNFGSGKWHSELATMIFLARSAVHSEGPQGSLESGNLVTRQHTKKAPDGFAPMCLSTGALNGRLGNLTFCNRGLGRPPMVRVLLVIQVPDASDKGSVPLSMLQAATMGPHSEAAP